MRQERLIQATIFEVFAEHEIGRELKAISQWLDEHRALLSLAASDLRRHGIQETGRHGLPAEAVVRCALLKQYRQLSYEELAFHLEDSASFRAFARLPLSWSPRKSVLQKHQRDQRGELGGNQSGCGGQRPAGEAGERGDGPDRQHRDAGANARAHRQFSAVGCRVRVMVRLLKQASALPGAPSIIWRNHRRLAKKRALAIQYSRGKAQKAKLYRELIAATRATVSTLEHTAQCLAAGATIKVGLWLGQVRHYLPLIERIITQAERRVLVGEAVPSGEKLVSLFEAHADIIVKGGREVHYGHKLNLTTGKSGLILDVVVEAGNPADAERFLPMLERHIARQGTVPRQTVSDGGYASLDNLKQAKALGVEDVAFHKKRALTIDAMVKSRWVYRKLKNFRAGIEANISCLKRAFGLARCTWRGLDHFKAYVWSSVVAYNLALFARLNPA